MTRLRREKDGINGQVRRDEQQKRNIGTFLSLQERYAEFIKTNRKLTAALEELKNFGTYVYVCIY